MREAIEMAADSTTQATPENNVESTSEERAIARAEFKRKRKSRFNGVARAVFHTDDPNNLTHQLRTFFERTGVDRSLPVAAHIAALLNPEAGWAPHLARFTSVNHWDSYNEYKKQ